MGIYYSYVNHDKREFVVLSDLRRGGDKVNAALVCAPALAYLLLPYSMDEYRGRWAGDRVEIVADTQMESRWTSVGRWHHDNLMLCDEYGYRNISKELLCEMQPEWGGLLG